MSNPTQPRLLPEPMRMPFGSAICLNAWAAVAVLAAFASRLLLREPLANNGAMRTAIALLPLLPGILYLRALARWIGGLDEMQRRLQHEAIGFAAWGMLLVALVADLLRTSGVLPRLNFGWEGYFAFTFLLYAIGLARANRRLR